MFLSTIRDDFAVRRQPLQSAVEIAAVESDEERRARRDSIRQHIAAGRMAERRWRQILADVDELNARKESLAASHVEACQPIQQSLAEIEQQQMSAILAREPADPALEDRRGLLLAELRDANEKLEDGIAAQDRLLRKLEGERIVAAGKVPTSAGPSEQDLLRTGSPVLLAKYALAKHDSRSAEIRLELLSDPLLGASAEEIVQAARCFERCQLAARSAYQQIIDE